MQFVADMATATLAAKLVDVMRGAGERPLIGIDLSATNIAYLRLCQVHLLFRARRMLLLGEVVLAETPVAIGTMSQRFLVAFVTTPRGSNAAVAADLSLRRLSLFVSHRICSPAGVAIFSYHRNTEVRKNPVDSIAVDLQGGNETVRMDIAVF